MESFALLIIDMQKAYFHNDALKQRELALVTAINELIDWARTSNRPVFNVVTHHQRDRTTWTLNMLDDDEGYLFADASDSDVVDGIKVSQATDIIKTRDSAFYGTDLADRLDTYGVDTVVLAGVSTHGCVLMTAADAYARNLRVVIASDAVATHDPRFHQPILEMLTQEYRQPYRTNRELRELMI